MSNPATFQVGSTYHCRSACSYETIFTYTVVARSAKFITLDTGKRVGVKTSAEGEWALPEGSYSMAPVIRAAAPKPELAWHNPTGVGGVT